MKLNIIDCEKYIVEEHYPKDVKFGGYKCIPKINDMHGYGKLYKLDIQIKYDANKELDKQVSNNGLVR